MKIVHQFKPIAYRLAPALYVVGENAILNWNAKNDHADQIRCDGGDGSRSLLDHFPNWPLSPLLSELLLTLSLSRVCLVRGAKGVREEAIVMRWVLVFSQRFDFLHDI